MLIVITLLLVVAMSLAASKPVNQIKEKGISIPVNPIKNGKWPGLGIMIFGFNVDTKVFDNDIDVLQANGFTEIRLDIQEYSDSDVVALSKAAALCAVAKGNKVIWGVTSLPPITSTNWTDFRAAILSAAQWAQDNGVFEFSLGNEEETKVDGTTLTAAQLRTNLKAVATDVQAIFTNGNISYSIDRHSIDSWVSIGKGDIDIMAANVYRGGDGEYSDHWKTEIDQLVAAFGVNGTYLTELNLSWSGINDYSIDEAVQAAAVKEMIDDQ